MLYPHPAAEDAARAIWRELVGTDAVPAETATHIGPSIDMLDGPTCASAGKERRHSSSETPISAAHEVAMKACKGQSETDRAGRF